MIEVNRDAGVTRGLDGAIQRLIVNGQTWQNLAERANSEHQRRISRYDGPPCPLSTDANPCLNGGICQPMLALYVCKCPLKYTGNHCENCKYMNSLYHDSLQNSILYRVRKSFCYIHI
jgi:hypothetical protein